MTTTTTKSSDLRIGENIKKKLKRMYSERVTKPMTPDQVGSSLDAIPAKPAQAAPSEAPTGVRTPTGPAAPRRPTTQQAQAGAAR